MALSLLAFACLLGAAAAGPYQRETETRCATECPTVTNEKFNYRPGSKYVYSFRTINYISVAGNRRQQKAEMKGVAEIYVKDKCEMALQLKDIEVHGDVDQEEAATIVESLTATPLSFSWVDGKIEHVCASPEENVFSENLKKGILSALMNTMPDWRSPAHYRETDSLGSCDTKYTIIRDLGSSITIRKEKALKSCDNRHSGVSALITNPYASPESDIHTLPIFTDEKLACEQEVKDRVIQSCVCKERAVVRPLQKYEDVIELQSEIYLTLTGVKQSSMRSIVPLTEKKTILYNYEQDKDVEARERETIEILKELCQETEHLLNPSVSKLFHRLITELKGLPPQSVHDIYEELKSQQLCRSQKTLDIFLDALPMAGTEGTIKLMVSLLKSKEVTGLKAKLWPASFALIPNPNAEAIAAVLPLLNSGERSRPVLLGMSAMIYRVCSRINCDSIPSVRDAVAVLHSVLGEHCSSENDNEVVSVLKAFGNMGYLGEAEKTVIECAKLKEKPIAVRLAAIDAFRRYTKKIPTQLVDIYADRRENFEVRIAALATVIKQADAYVVKAIEQVLESNDDEQVVSYTSSLVKNWQETSSPLKKDIKELLENVKVSHVNVSYWQNSKNIEFSAFNVPSNLGGALESNIVHSPESKIPRSFSARVDVDLFGRNVNLFEFGARAEGLEQAVKKMLGQEKRSSMKSSWFRLSPRQGAEEESASASFYLRTMETEFFDITVSDLNRMGKMMEFADVMNKLAQGEKTDFAHSFLFLNNKLVIQSITGRSYTFAITGSATVGLTANGKLDVVDLMSSPQNCDIQTRIQPSANVELAAVVGIHSKGTRPSIKIVTSFHSEADVGAAFRVKDGHMVEARWEVPSEKVSVFKISTELFEVDANNNEKPIIEEMQRRIDHCMTMLEKPLGIQVCGKLETPRPFISKSFPYAHGLGNVEFYIKKTDPSLKNYIASLEIPRRVSDFMTYRMMFDTPGSSVNRKFQANLQLKKSATGEREFNLDMQCPFKDLSASGSFMWQRDLAQSSISIIVDKTRRYSLKAVVEKSTSGPEKMLKPTLQVIMPNAEPLTVSGSIVYSKARKEHLKIDLRTNKPGTKPLVFTGNWKKEGQLGWSKNSQWKMSCDLVTKSPFLSVKMHTTVQKQAGQIESLTSSVSLDYETQQKKKQSVKFSSGIRRNHAKISSVAKFENTQMPSLNWEMNWDMQGDPRDAMKNELVFRYSSQPENRYVQISQTSHVGDAQSLSEGKIAIKVPQFNIDSELNIAADMHTKETSNFHVEADLRYKADKHVKSLIQVKHISKSPVKMTVKATLEYPGRKMMYEDSIVETNRGVYEGRSNLQWQENQQATLQYKYKKLSDSSSMTHEIESKLDAPFLSGPVTQRGMLNLMKWKLKLRNEVVTSSNSRCIVDAELSKTGSSRLSVTAPAIEGSVELANYPKKKSANFDVQFKGHKTRHVTGSASLNLERKKSFEAELVLDAARSPSSKVAVSAEIELEGKKSRSTYRIGSKVQLLDILAVDMSCRGERSLRGPHELQVEVSSKRFEPISAEVRQAIIDDSVHMTAKVKKNRREIAVLETQGKYARKSNGCEIEASATLKSPEQIFTDKELYFRHSYSQSFVATNLLSTLKVEYFPGRVHEMKFEYSRDAKKSHELKLGLKTPWRRFLKQEITFTHHVTSDGHTFNAVVECNRKEVSVMSTIKNRDDEMSLTTIFKSPFYMIREVEHYIAYVNRKHQKSLETHLDANGERKYGTSLSYACSRNQMEITYTLETFMTPQISASVKSEMNRPSFSHELVITKKSLMLMSAKIAREAEGEDHAYLLEIKSSKRSLLDLKVIKETKGALKKYLLKAKGPFTPLTLTLHLSKNDENSLTTIFSACKETRNRQCYNVKGYYKKETNSAKYIRFRKITLDIEKASEQGAAEHICNIHYLLSQQESNIKSKLFIDSKNERIGYDLALKMRRHEEDPYEMDVSFHLPQRTMRASFSGLHNKRMCMFDSEFTPDAGTPSQKLSLHWRREWNSQYNELSGYFKCICFEHEPLVIKYYLSKPERTAKLEISYSSRAEEKLTAEAKYEAEENRLKSVTGRIYCGAHNLDVNAVMLRTENQNQESYNCRWSCQLGHHRKVGEVNLSVTGRVRRGLPRKIELVSTCVPYILTAEVLSIPGSLLPSDAKVILAAEQKKLGEFLYHRSGRCFDYEWHIPEPFWKTHVCFPRTEEDRIKLLTVDCYHREKKCLDLNIEFDPSKKHATNFDLEWKKEEFRDAAETLERIASKTKDVVLSEYYECIAPAVRRLAAMLEEKLWKTCKSLVVKRTRPLLEYGEKKVAFIKNYIKECYEKIPKIPSFDEAVELVERFVHEHFPYYLEKMKECLDEHIPRWWKEQFEKWLKVLEKYIKEYCVRGTLCYDIKRTYQRRGLKETHLLLKAAVFEKMKRVRITSDQRLSEVRSWFEWYFQRVFDCVHQIAEKVKYHLSSFKNTDIYKKLEEKYHLLKGNLEEKFRHYFEKVMEMVDDLLDHARRSENFKKLSYFTQEVKAEALKALKRIDTKNLVQSVQEIIMQKLPREWIKERVMVKDFNVSEGRVRLQLHNPLGFSYWKILRNTFTEVNNANEESEYRANY